MTGNRTLLKVITSSRSGIRALLVRKNSLIKVCMTLAEVFDVRKSSESLVIKEGHRSD